MAAVRIPPVLRPKTGGASEVEAGGANVGEVLRTLTAFWFERRFEWKTLLLIPLLRFGYRQLLYITAIRGMFRALTGHPTGWYKIDRIGTRLQAGRHKSSG